MTFLKAWGITDPAAVQTRMTEYLQGPVSSVVNKMLSILTVFQFSRLTLMLKGI